MCSLKIAKMNPITYFKTDLPDPTVDGGKLWLIHMSCKDIDRTRTCAWASVNTGLVVCLAELKEQNLFIKTGQLLGLIIKR